MGSGVVKTETRNVSEFHRIALGVPATVELHQGGPDGVSITGEDNVVPLVETVVDNGTLKIRWSGRRDYSIDTTRDITIVVNARTIDGLAIAGAGRIHAVRLKTNAFHASLAGSGGVSIDSLDADSASTSIDGSGELKAAGRADVLEASIAGSGSLSAAKLKTNRARITLAGSGDASVWATETLAARIAGSGEVKYYGTPQVSSTVAGSGAVRQAGNAP